MVLEFPVTDRPDRVSDDARAKILQDPGFGNYFTDHMVTIDWDAADGWHDARVAAYGPF